MSEIWLSACSITSGSCVAQATAAPVVAGEPREQDRDRDRVRTVEAGGRLVGEEEHRPRDDRAGDRDAGPLPLREPADALRRALAEADRLERGERRRADRPRARAARARARRSRARRGAARAPPAGRRRRSSRGAGAARPARSSDVSSTPSTMTVPPSGSSRPASRCSSVVFPEPDGPVIACSRPACSSRSRPSEHGRLRRSDLRRPRASTTTRRVDRSIGYRDGFRQLFRHLRRPGVDDDARRPRSERVAFAPIPARSSSSSGRRSQPPRPTTIVSLLAVARPFLRDATVADAHDPVGDRAPTPDRG